VNLKSLAAMLILGASAVTASTITIDSVDWGRGGMVDFLENGSPVTGYAGAIMGTYNGGPTLTFLCVDLFTDISYGTYGSTTIFPRPWRNEDRVAWLYETQLGTITSAELGEALQLAFWDIVHDNGDGPGAGAVAASASTPAAVVAAWINFVSMSVGQSSANVSIFRNYNLGDLSPAQNLIGPLQSDTVNAPEPATGFLLLTGIGLVGVSRLRKRKLL